MFKLLEKKRADLESGNTATCDAGFANINPDKNSSIIRAALDAIVMINDKGEILEFNPSAEKIFGYNHAEVRGKNIADIIIPPSLREQHRKGFNRYLKTGKKKILDKKIEITAMRVGGEEFPVELTLTEINLNNDRLFTAFIRDITERVEAEQRLIESKGRYRTIFEGVPECVKTITADGMLLNMNPAGLAYIEADSFGQVEGLCVYDLVVPEDRDAFIKMNERVFKGETVDLQFRIEGLKGKRRWMETHAVPVYETGNDSIVVGHLAITRDITKRIKNQNALIESEERFRSSFEHAPFCMGIGDREGHILQVNNALCELTGYSEKELLNKNFREFVHPDDIEQSVQNLTQLFAGEVDYYQQQRRMLHKEGHYLWADINVSAIKDADGKPQYLINHLQDITERKQSELLQESQEKILKQIISGAPQQDILIKLCLMFEALAPAGAKASILLLNPDDKKLYDGAAPNFSNAVLNAFNGLMTGDCNATCGTAAFRGERVIVEDVSISPLWKDYRDFALDNQLLACWSTPFFSENGDVLGTFAISLPRPSSPTKHDLEILTMAGYLASIIVERTRAEIELKESEARFRGAFGNAPTGTVLVDKNGVILQTNSRSTEVIGFRPEEIIGKSIAEVSHPDDIASSIEKFKALMSGKIEAYQLEKRYLHKQGGFVWCRLNISSICDQNDKPLYAIAHIEDISERKRNEEELFRYNRSLKVLNQCNDVLIHATEVTNLLNEVCNILIDTGGYRFAWVGIAQSDKNKSVVPMAKAGYESGYLNDPISWAKQKRYFCPVTEAINNLKPSKVRNIKTDPRKITWRDAALERGYLSTIALPMKYNEQSFGAIVIYSSEQDVFDEEEISLLINLTDNIAYGIQSINNKYIREIAEKSLRVSEKNFRTLFDENPCMFFTVDEEATVLAANKFGAAELGYETEDIIGRPFLNLIGKGQTLLVTGHLKHCLKYPDDLHRWEMQTKKKNGAELWVRVISRVAVDQNNNNTILIVCEDITEARMLSNELVYQATHDSLTGLINRHEFETRLHRAINSAQLEHTEHVLCYLDLDQFKIINDTCGHMAGDGLLRQLSEIMQGHIRNRDSLARLGGDEFGVLIEHCSLKKAEQIAESLRQAIADFQFYWDDKVYRVGVSIGMVSINKNTPSISNILMAADNACYTAKDKGRNRIHIHEEGDTDLENRRREMLWTTRIQKALEEDRFCLAVQEIIPLDSKHDEGNHYEILVRMKNENGEMIPPGLFIPVAERFNLITKIDQCVVNMALDWLNYNPDFLEQLGLLSINLSGPSLGDDDFLEFITQKLSESKIQIEKICFEITETAAIANLNSANNFITHLKQKGCKFALDDFGSGLSSFGYLKTLDVDYLKIDGVFVRDIEKEQSDLAIVKSIHEIGRALDKETIAEFVESEAILNILKGIGVDYAQGYAISRPQLLEELSDSIKSESA